MYYRRLNTGRIGIVRDPEHIQDYPAQKNRPHINILLFVATFFTTSFSAFFLNESIISFGIPYSLTLLTILASHEFGHYFAARYFGVKATLPYFIPLPTIVGTMGAVIRVKTPIPDRRALFYIGAMGPLPGFILSLAAVVIGIYFADIVPLTISEGAGEVWIFGDSLLLKFIIYLIHGPLPAGHDIVLTPYMWAGWIGFLVTSLNLMPIGQLDGGHILYALIGKNQRYFGWVTLAGLVVLSFFFYGWILWIIMTLVVLMVAHPPIPEKRELSRAEIVTGWACMVILLMTFIPVPVKIL